MVKSIIEGLNFFRVTNRGRKALMDRLSGTSFSAGRKHLRDFRALEIKTLTGSDYFVGLKVTEMEFKELTLTPEADLH